MCVIGRQTKRWLSSAMLVVVLTPAALAVVTVTEDTTTGLGYMETLSTVTALQWDQGLNDEIAGWSVLQPTPYYGESDGQGGFNFLNNGVVLEDATGAVLFADITSGQVTEDIRLNTTESGNPTSIRFVAPGDANTPMEVHAVGLRAGNNGPNIDFSFYDVNDTLINTLVVTGGLGLTPVFVAHDDGNPVAAIHRIDVTYDPTPGGSYTVLGSFNLSTDLNDLMYTSEAIPPVSAFTWSDDDSGQWTAAGNWNFGLPNSNEHSATFGSAITSPQTVTIDSPITVNALGFDNANQYSVAGSGTLTLAAKGDGTLPAVNVLQGSHEMQARVAIGADTTVTATDGSIDFNNQMDLGGFTLTTDGNVNINHSTINGGSVISEGALGTAGATSIGSDLTSTGSLEIDLGPANTDFFNVSGSATIDGTLNITLEPGFTPSGSFTVLTAAGGITDNGITLTGAGGFTKSIVDGMGDAQSLLVTIGLAGDFNGDGTVDAADYVTWRDSDGTQDGYNTWRANFGNSAGSGSGALARIPEPATSFLVLVSVCAVFSRCLKKASCE